MDFLFIKIFNYFYNSCTLIGRSMGYGFTEGLWIYIIIILCGINNYLDRCKK